MSHLEFFYVRSECMRSFGVSKNIRGLLLFDESIEDKVRVMKSGIVLVFENCIKAIVESELSPPI